MQRIPKATSESSLGPATQMYLSRAAIREVNFMRLYTSNIAHLEPASPGVDPRKAFLHQWKIQGGHITYELKKPEIQLYNVVLANAKHHYLQSETETQRNSVLTYAIDVTTGSYYWGYNGAGSGSKSQWENAAELLKLKDHGDIAALINQPRSRKCGETSALTAAVLKGASLENLLFISLRYGDQDRPSMSPCKDCSMEIIAHSQGTLMYDQHNHLVYAYKGENRLSGSDIQRNLQRAAELIRRNQGETIENSDIEAVVNKDVS